MSATRTEARNEMYTIVTDANESNPASLPYTPELFYRDVTEPGKPGERIWLRASVQTVDTEQTTLSTYVGKPGQRRYTTDGFIVVQLFMPKSDDESPELGGMIADVIKSAFRTKQSAHAIVYRNIRINELPQENQYYRLNVIAEFQYDEVNKE